MSSPRKRGPIACKRTCGDRRRGDVPRLHSREPTQRHALSALQTISLFGYLSTRADADRNSRNAMPLIVLSMLKGTTRPQMPFAGRSSSRNGTGPGRSNSSKRTIRIGETCLTSPSQEFPRKGGSPLSRGRHLVCSSDTSPPRHHAARTLPRNSSTAERSIPDCWSRSRALVRTTDAALPVADAAALTPPM